MIEPPVQGTGAVVGVAVGAQAYVHRHRKAELIPEVEQAVDGVGETGGVVERLPRSVSSRGGRARLPRGPRSDSRSCRHFVSRKAWDRVPCQGAFRGRAFPSSSHVLARILHLYFDAGRIRRDNTEGRPGTPLLLALEVVSASACSPIRDAVVDVWHCDAIGLYSGYGSEGTAGERFLRGIQVTDASGVAEFDTIYPGFYRGRTIHVHFRIDAQNACAETPGSLRSRPGR